MTISLLRRRREQRAERERRQASLRQLAAALGNGRRVLVDGDRPEGMYDVVATDASPNGQPLNAHGFFVTTAPPAGFAAVHPIDGLFVATNDPRWCDVQLHLGSGPVTLPGWINIDNLPYPGVDLVWDLARGIPLRDAKYVFAEHFIEHLTFDQAVQFVRNCRAALRDDGILRLSTPNLDWVWHTSYASGDALRDCFVINRAFHGWGHQFLYNLQTLTNLLHDNGFESVQPFGYGESDTPALRGIERHEQYPDSPALPHILIVEARGRRAAENPRHPMIEEFRRDVAVR